MRGALQIARREFAGNFGSPVAYVAISAFLVVCGLKVFVIDDFLDAREASLRSLFELIPVFFVFYLPAIAMRSLAEERRTGTYELLMTLPISEAEIVLGKFLAALMFLVVTLLMTGAYPILVIVLGAPDPGPLLGGYLGLVLAGSSVLALSVMTSAWTSSQIVAYILSAALAGLLVFLDQLVGVFWEGARPVLEFLSLRAHFLNFTRGAVDSRDLVYFLSLTAAGLIVATFSLSERRWR